MFRPLSLALIAACAPAEPGGGRPVDTCDDGSGQTEVLLLSELTFARDLDGVTPGFDLDSEVSVGGGVGGCGVADSVSPDGTPGIDNSFARLIPALELTEAAALEAIVAEAIHSGGLLVMVELSDVDDLVEDPCVDLAITGGIGVPMIGADGRVLPAQTFFRDPEAAVSEVRNSAVVDGVIEDGPIDLDLPFSFLDAEVVFHLKQGRIRMQRETDGRVSGMVGGGIAIQDLSDLAHNTGINQEVEDLLDAVLGVAADLDPGADGECQQISVTLEFEAIPAFFFAE